MTKPAFFLGAWSTKIKGASLSQNVDILMPGMSFASQDFFERANPVWVNIAVDPQTFCEDAEHLTWRPFTGKPETYVDPTKGAQYQPRYWMPKPFTGAIGLGQQILMGCAILAGVNLLFFLSTLFMPLGSLGRLHILYVVAGVGLIVLIGGLVGNYLIMTNARKMRVMIDQAVNKAKA